MTSVGGGVIELPELDPSDPLSAELDEAYFLLARGQAGAEDVIASIEAKIYEREASKRRDAEMARRSASHQRRQLEAQTAAEHAEARRKADEGQAALEPMWAQLDAAAVEFAKVAARVMDVSVYQVNVSPHDKIIERLRVALFRATDGAVQRRLLNEIGRPLAQNRQLESPLSAVIESE